MTKAHFAMAQAMGSQSSLNTLDNVLALRIASLTYEILCGSFTYLDRRRDRRMPCEGLYVAESGVFCVKYLSTLI